MKWCCSTLKLKGESIMCWITKCVVGSRYLPSGFQVLSSPNPLFFISYVQYYGPPPFLLAISCFNFFILSMMWIIFFINGMIILLQHGDCHFIDVISFNHLPSISSWCSLLNLEQLSFIFSLIFL